MSQAGALNVVSTPLPPDIPLIFEGNTGPGATASVPPNTIFVLGGSGATTNASGNTITINVVGTGFTWNVVTSAMNPVTLVPENGYIANGAGVVNFILPPLAAIGDTYWIKGRENLWTLSQNAGQFVSIGNSSSMPGIFGSIQATMVSDALQLLCVSANTEFTEIGIQGNPTLI